MFAKLLKKHVEITSNDDSCESKNLPKKHLEITSFQDFRKELNNRKELICLEDEIEEALQCPQAINQDIEIDDSSAEFCRRFLSINKNILSSFNTVPYIDYHPDGCVALVWTDMAYGSLSVFFSSDEKILYGGFISSTDETICGKLNIDRIEELLEIIDDFAS